MYRRHPAWWLSVAAVFALPALVTAAEQAKPNQADRTTIDFARDVQPIFAEKCFNCHGPDKAEGGLRLNRPESALAETDSGERAIVPGDVDSSEILRRIASDDPDERMPPKGDPLAAADIERIKQWIVGGAEWAVHWSYRPVERPELPAVKNKDWPRNEIDRFVLARLEAAGIAPSSEADRFALIKRLYLDLTGLPPEPAEVDTWIDRLTAGPTGRVQSSPNTRGPLASRLNEEVYEALVDQLLASPHFGERWGRHWLDKARYADSDGYEKDKPRPNAWRYRDWVIDAINADMPFDQFTIEQLAGDLLPDATPMQRLATAFHRQTLTNTEGGADQEQFRVEACFDRVETTGAVWLGLTVGCARCHSHKYDQISQREYYRLFAFFNSGGEANTDVPKDDPALVQTQQAKPEQISVRVIAHRPRKTHLLHRGDFLSPEDEVRPATLSTLHSFQSRHEDGPADRLDFARWLVAPDNPLTPRVTVNQIWTNLFGAGLVRTANDFGVRGERPTHPQLLDWLAGEMVRRGWSRKAMIKLIVMSAAYRQSSHYRPECVAADPENRLLHRQNRYRVEGEIVRDVYLSIAGLLAPKIGGPSVFPPLPPDVAALSYANNFKWKTSKGEDRYRRGMYTFFKRTAPHPNLTTFDCPDANTTKVKRDISNSPLQPLTLLNNLTFVEASQALARRLHASSFDGDRSRLEYGYRLCAIRPPSAFDLDRFQSLLDKSREWYSQHKDDAAKLVGDYQVKEIEIDEAAAWVATSRILLNLDATITRE
jgi:mono/diheme cytochrome c family protein